MFLTQAMENFDIDDGIQEDTGGAVEITPVTVNHTTSARITGRQDPVEITTDEELVSEHQFWLQWMQDEYPDLDSETHFLPFLYFNRVPKTILLRAKEKVAVVHSPGHLVDIHTAAPQTASANPHDCKVLKSPIVQKGHVRDDKAMSRVLLCLRKMFKPDQPDPAQRKEVMFITSNLELTQSFCDSKFKSLLPPDTHGELDVLIIHQQYGLIVCEVKAVGDIDQSKDYSKKLKKAVIQLNGAKDFLSHVTSDVAPHLRITKTIAVPNLTESQLLEAAREDSKLIEDMCQCLESSDFANIPQLCLCSDQLFDPTGPEEKDINQNLTELQNWWHRRVAVKGPDPCMTPELYKILIARFCGPPTKVTVPCISRPRFCVKTESEAISLSGKCYADIALFPEQLKLLNSEIPTVFLTGPPGTGKTVVLQLKGIEWLYHGNTVYIVSTGKQSRAVCNMLFYLLQKTAQDKKLLGRPELLERDFTNVQEMRRTAEDLSQKATNGTLHIIVDEAAPDRAGKEARFKTFCTNLKKKNTDLFLWAASCYFVQAHEDWTVKEFKKPLRFPPTIVTEVRKDRAITTDKTVKDYGARGVPDYTAGPKVKIVAHKKHKGSPDPIKCAQCSDEVIKLLRNELRVGVEAGDDGTRPQRSKTVKKPPSLSYKDVFVLYRETVPEDAGMVKALREKEIPFKILKDDEGFEDISKADSDVVWLATGDHVRGLERKVVVCIEVTDDPEKTVRFQKRLHSMSRCSSQLIIVQNSEDRKPAMNMSSSPSTTES